MKKLIALLAAIGAVVFFWRKKQQAEDSMWDADRPAGSWAEAAADTAAEGGETATGAATEAAEEEKDATSE